jgi:hypothetical protein
MSMLKTVLTRSYIPWQELVRLDEDIMGRRAG